MLTAGESVRGHLDGRLHSLEGRDSPSPMPTKNYSPPKVNCAKGQSPWATGNGRRGGENVRRLEAVASVSKVEQSPTGHQEGLAGL